MPSQDFWALVSAGQDLDLILLPFLRFPEVGDDVPASWRSYYARLATPGDNDLLSHCTTMPYAWSTRWMRRRGDRLKITTGKYAGHEGTVESNVYQRTVDYPDESSSNSTAHAVPQSFVAGV